MNKLQKMLAAQKAWDDAIAAKAADAEQARLKTAAEAAIADYTAEVVAASKSAPNPAPKTGAAGEVTEEDLIAACGKALNPHLDRIKAMFDERDRASVTPQMLTDAVKAAFAAEKTAKTDLKPADVDIEQLATKAFGIVMQNQRSTIAIGKALASAEDAKAKGGGQVTLEWGMSKHTLPPHMKQLSNVLLGRPEMHGIDEATAKQMNAADDRMWNGVLMGGGQKSLTGGGTGTGAEWVPRSLSAELHRRLYLESQLAAWYLNREVEMPNPVYDYPLLTTNPTFYLNNVENRDAEASDPGTSKITLTAQRLAALCQFSYDADEDSVVPLLPTLQDLLAKAAARALENAIINGDTTATHQDTGSTVGANDQLRAWKGFRKLALAVSALKTDLSSGGLTEANLLSVLKLLGKWGVKTNEIMWIVGPKSWNTLLGLESVRLAYARGAVGSYIAGGPTPAPWGGTIIVSEMAREDLNASGVWDNSTTTKGLILAVNGANFILGRRRQFTIEVGRNIKSQTHEIVASFRRAFQPVETPASTTAQTVACGYNYTS